MHATNLRSITADELEMLIIERPATTPLSPELQNALRLYHGGMSITAAAKQAGLKMNLLNLVIQKTLRRARHPSRWKMLSEQSKASLNT
jgi:hypothetical protein